MRKFYFICMFICMGLTLSISSSAQRIAKDTYWFYFTDKKDNGFSIEQPEAFLSQRSIDRRAWQSLPIDNTDTPVSQSYVDSLKNLGLKILFTSKWLNGVLVSSNNKDLIDTLYKVSFIDSLMWEPDPDDLYFPSPPGGSRFTMNAEGSTFNYGYAVQQLDQINLPFMHRKGFTGKGVLIAVLDAGFNKMTILPAFADVYAENRILATHDFVNGQTDVYHSHNHGTYVSSIIISSWNDSLIGAAPDAELILALTENPASETRIEEYSWIAGAEWADSIGADVFNTSLGYTEFDDSTTNYVYSDMDGKTSHISIANGMTASKGIVSTTSAGNEGDASWHYIGAPADANNILSVGAVDFEGNIVDFSSRGPSADLRIKPDVSAMGYGTAVQTLDSAIRRGSGTSFSSPLIAGAAAVLWQALPGLTASEIIEIIIQSGDRYNNPDNDYGYGIPNFKSAYQSITGADKHSFQAELRVYPNPFDSYIVLGLSDFNNIPATLRLMDLQGRIVFSATIKSLESRIYIPETLNSGMYIIELRSEKEKQISRIIKR